MSGELEPTGERVIEEAYYGSRGAFTIYVLHAASYSFAERYCVDARTIDLGCGSGYGAARISAVARAVVGVDVSSEAVAFAQARYDLSNLTFKQIDPDARLPFNDGKFDVALSFQVIEHVTNDERYIEEAFRVLRPGGVLILITPDRRYRLFPGQKPWNRWHLREYSMRALCKLVRRQFVIEQALRMGAPWSIASIEFRRYRLAKWLTLPMTLPFVPENLRRRGLDLIHALRTQQKPVAANMRDCKPDYGFDETAILVGKNPPNPINLVVIARKPWNSGSSESSKNYE